MSRLTRVVPKKGPLNGCVCLCARCGRVIRELQCPFCQESSSRQRKGEVWPLVGVKALFLSVLWYWWYLGNPQLTSKKSVKTDVVWVKYVCAWNNGGSKTTLTNLWLTGFSYFITGWLVYFWCQRYCSFLIHFLTPLETSFSITVMSKFWWLAGALWLPATSPGCM